MSNESSVSETTPLRRPPSQLSADTEANVADTRQSTVSVVNNNNHSNNNNHYSNLVEVRLQEAEENQQQQQQQQEQRENMDTNKRILCRVGLDILILLCVGFPILLFFLLGDPYKRGFFCDDESLKHPFHDSTVRNWMLYFIGVVIPVGVILTVEVLISRCKAKRDNGNATSRRYVFMKYELPDWLIECYKKVGIYGFGAAVSQLTTDIAKYSIGRLRPHFIAVCQPILADGTTCNDAQNAGKYIQEFTCQGLGSSARMLKEMRLSFPSGHSSFTFFAMVYMALYLQSRMTWHGSKLLRHLLQFVFIMIAWYTALSRVSDYKHHWSDVLAGALIGSTCALVVANYVSDLFQTSSTKPYLPRTAQDMGATTITTQSPPLGITVTTN
ncbi:putative phosphatidate phosphatase isoform X1 [Drosophila pseudoobscura]|uniref:Phosphatidate phosphatase isoform X1 n=1 Tax=Drosophila pseudoobscura pseudoobscura TaxID=46245 RepID=A0A6I8UV32_DROPS|nr:putative phosphatidate phosphatase isoform X1 [Drosophila pseudoobscura]